MEKVKYSGFCVINLVADPFLAKDIIRNTSDPLSTYLVLFNKTKLLPAISGAARCRANSSGNRINASNYRRSNHTRHDTIGIYENALIAIYNSTVGQMTSNKCNGND